MMPSRVITDHKVNPANDTLTITVIDGPGAGGASHLYRVHGYDEKSNAASTRVHPTNYTDILFQNGPINEVGVNGITQEVLLAIVADRLRSFQAGAFASPYNAEALSHVEAAQAALHARTKARMSRGVEGTHKV